MEEPRELTEPLLNIINDFQVSPNQFSTLYNRIMQVAKKHNIDRNIVINGVLKFLYDPRLNSRDPKWVNKVSTWLREDSQKFINLQC